MSAYNIEFLSTRSGDPNAPASGAYAKANVTGTANGSWANAVTSGNMTFSPSGNVKAVLYNSGTDAIAVTQDAAADPAKYTVVAPGTQRALNVTASLALKVKTL